ncbi:GNAT family N-acetyltransferase [Microbacterium betulae]|uniref:GNAT family N-acetyltransferase n=1 Tax=Microbacterium betulae TaxID=2981139 RepID=A0AA97FEK0_9MICO|nr:GNAT family N-acetyltransferase [Microbacterium sp. AB]WOF21478.1 GNAT family N-acetyltransferase [Microbacterium sp. AB]
MSSSRRPLPRPTSRVRFRELVEEDIEEMAAMLGDPEVMAFYPAPKTHEETAGWIARARASYEEHGHGMWAIETPDGRFLGDCGITWQSVNGRAVREVGYHVVRAEQGRGLATEAARACVELVRERFAPTLLTAIIHPENTASRRVAEKLGMAHIDDDHAHPWIVRTVMGMDVERRA